MIIYPRMSRSEDESPGWEIRKLDGKFGVVHSVTGEVALPYEYDNIFLYGNAFVLCQDGKWGAARNADCLPEQIAPCAYDAIDTDGMNWIFSSENEILYYSNATNDVRTFQYLEQFFASVYAKYLFAQDDEHYYVIDGWTGDELWKHPVDDQAFFSSPHRPFLRYLGRKNDLLPLFFDLNDQVYLLPCSETDPPPQAEVPELLWPVVVNGLNIVNILKSGTGLKVSELGADFPADIAQEEGFAQVTVEVKVTLESPDRTEERCYPIPDGVFWAGEPRDHFGWE